MPSPWGPLSGQAERPQSPRITQPGQGSARPRTRASGVGGTSPALPRWVAPASGSASLCRGSRPVTWELRGWVRTRSFPSVFRAAAPRDAESPRLGHPCHPAGTRWPAGRGALLPLVPLAGRPGEHPEAAPATAARPGAAHGHTGGGGGRQALPCSGLSSLLLTHLFPEGPRGRAPGPPVGGSGRDPGRRPRGAREGPAGGPDASPSSRAPPTRPASCGTRRTCKCSGSLGPVGLGS